eukprot:scaffold628589_cov38-Prasinocladus_malaysianus.AAC.1
MSGPPRSKTPTSSGLPLGALSIRYARGALVSHKMGRLFGCMPQEPPKIMSSATLFKSEGLES